MEEETYDSVAIYVKIENLNSDIYQYKNLIQYIIPKINKRLDIIVHCQEIIENIGQIDLWKKWNDVEHLLSSLYVVASEQAYRYDKILLDVNVIFEKWCNYDIFIEENWGILILPNDMNTEWIEEINQKRENMQIEKINYIKNQFIVESVVVQDTAEESQQDCFVETHQRNIKNYSTVVLGGTFDHLHNGHKILLTTCAWLTSNKLVCGITGTI